MMPVFRTFIDLHTKDRAIEPHDRTASGQNSSRCWPPPALQTPVVYSFLVFLLPLSFPPSSFLLLFLLSFSFSFSFFAPSSYPFLIFLGPSCGIYRQPAPPPLEHYSGSGPHLRQHSCSSTFAFASLASHVFPPFLRHPKALLPGSHLLLLRPCAPHPPPSQPPALIHL